MPKYKWGITKPTTPKAEAPKTEAPKTEAPKTEAPKTTDKTPKTTDKTTKTEDKKDDAKAAKVPDGPGKCVKEAKCDKEDTATKLMVTCDAVRLGAAALAALAVATTL
jgi:translation initiation factor IF-2